MTIGGTGVVESGFGGALDLGEVEVPRSDDGSLAINVSSVFADGLRIFGKTYVDPVIYVNTNGTLSIGAALSSYPTVDMTHDMPVIAAFWGDVDTRLDGEGTESGGIWADIDSGKGVFTVTWSDVGVYRRNADLTNLFQVQLYDRGGGDFDVAFRYQRIEWTIGTAEDDTGAVVGLFDPVGADVTFGGSDLGVLDVTRGNGGVQGLWIYSVINGGIQDYFTQSTPITGSTAADTLMGSAGVDHILTYAGNDSVDAGDGSDTIDAGLGDDFIFAGAGNDQVFGGAGSDSVIGSVGADQIYGDDGNDVLTGSSRSDTLFGGNGDDFLNGGWGHDRLTGGAGADRFYHEGVAGHGSDWITDFYAPEGDMLVFGGPSASASDFIVQFAQTPGAGQAAVAEAFVTYVPTGQILWAIEDGALAQTIPIWTSDGIFELV